MKQHNIDGVQIAAGGYGTRLRAEMDRLGYQDVPKHLLPTSPGGSETLLGRIVRQALSAPGEGKVTIHANEQNCLQILDHPDIDTRAKVVVSRFDNSLGPFTDHLQRSGQRTLGCAGDFYADFSWEGFVASHDAAGYPVSFMVGRTVAVDGGATFDIADDGQITALYRADRTAPSELINIGAYIFDADSMVLKILDEMTGLDTPSKEDVLVQRLIGGGLVGAYVIDGVPFNINTLETYQALLDFNAQQQNPTG